MNSYVVHTHNRLGTARAKQSWDKAKTQSQVWLKMQSLASEARAGGIAFLWYSESCPGQPETKVKKEVKDVQQEQWGGVGRAGEGRGGEGPVKSQSFRWFSFLIYLISCVTAVLEHVCMHHMHV